MDQDDEAAALSVRLDVHLDRRPISGRMRTALGADEPFVGWLGFVEALQRMQDRRAPAPETGANDTTTSTRGDAPHG